MEGLLIPVVAAFISITATLVHGTPPSAGSFPTSGSPSGPCPPPNFGNLTSLNLAAYISAPWYVQKMIPLDYQPVDEAYCVRAEYTLLDPRNVSGGLIVYNSANKGGVNGPSVGTSKNGSLGGSRLIAVPTTFKAKGRDGKLLVGPELLQQLLPGDAWRAAFGPYWIVAVGYSQNISLRYEWAIISGGPPTFTSPSGDGCSSVPYSTTPAAVPRAATAGGWPSTRGGDGASGGGGGGNPFGQLASVDKGGLWFFTRKTEDPGSLARMEVRAKALGLDTSRMIPVQQRGCLYP
ncbi:hypothetical protein VOLCADRAFT_103569 [Volvox carteri f. nagariensis]|uniref:Lipocalin/cytosolic fatty-acid binding domain-containing protein n=1 Tax=Volvox carteri f. nagariensis TaxID=3068 RepID=D8TMV3_VOLCA|nr:uncharacterized protein VOLCADRAFT_103569 [Volvox carteri f. nagariensis]EFJ51320.1 hypothetical protein VOLCADRAFT_103569 [Volvox carteri f. nagariensis]|eukprot:XP_002947787.1 hypothetical protein VOLCADRAFT_103569 [Volvox carteri f. nagariensis]